MESATRKRARAFVVAGFVMAAAGSVITLLRSVTYFANASALSVFESVVSPLIGVVAVWSWWWLSKIRVADRHQSSFVRMGLYGLALQNILIGALGLATLFDLPGFDRNSWNVAPLWSRFWGNLAISIGFVLLAREMVDDAGERGESIEDVIYDGATG